MSVIIEISKELNVPLTAIHYLFIDCTGILHFTINKIHFEVILKNKNSRIVHGSIKQETVL